jgi:SWIM zinc finger
MIRIESTPKMKAAAERGKGQLKVKMVGFRKYEVTNKQTGAVYTVVFTFERGIRKGSCSCKAGQQGYTCKHLAISAGVHSAIAAHRRDQ